MSPRLSRRAGVTLIEVLLAVSLLSLLSVGMLMAMRIGFNTLEKTDTHLEKNRRVANSRKIIENELAGFILTKAEWVPKPDVVFTFPFVQWEPSSMRFVTAYSLRDGWRGRPQIAALQVIPREKGEGVRLIVNETPYTGPREAGLTIAGLVEGVVQFAPILPGDGSFVLADRLSYCRFSYLEPIYEPPFQVWRPLWKIPVNLPLGVRIEMAPLDSAPSELRVTTVTVPLEVNRKSIEYRDVPTFQQEQQ